jgi:hypothetical protein
MVAKRAREVAQRVGELFPVTHRRPFFLRRAG